MCYDSVRGLVCISPPLLCRAGFGLVVINIHIASTAVVYVLTREIDLELIIHTCSCEGLRISTPKLKVVP